MKSARSAPFDQNLVTSLALGTPLGGFVGLYGDNIGVI